jgi:hypothetical protein
MEDKKPLFEESDEEFLPVLHELHKAIKNSYLRLKIETLNNTSVKATDIVIHDLIKSKDQYLLPVHNCGISLVHEIDSSIMSTPISVSTFSDETKVIDLLIAIKVFGDVNRFPHEYKEKILLFASTGQRVRVPTAHGTEFQPAESIIYIEAFGNDSYIYYVSGKRTIPNKPLGFFVDHFPKDIFIRIGDKHLINSNFIKLVSKSEDEVTLEKPDGIIFGKDFHDVLPVGRTYKALFIDFLNRYF